jgi:hypothetical protein
LCLYFSFCGAPFLLKYFRLWLSNWINDESVKMTSSCKIFSLQNTLLAPLQSFCLTCFLNCSAVFSCCKCPSQILSCFG